LLQGNVGCVIMRYDPKISEIPFVVIQVLVVLLLLVLGVIFDKRITIEYFISSIIVAASAFNVFAYFEEIPMILVPDGNEKFSKKNMYRKIAIVLNIFIFVFSLINLAK